AQAALAGARGTILVVPDGRDLGRLDVALTQALGPGRHVALSADLGATARYRRWLSVRRGAVRVVAGTRTAAFAPVTDLGLAAIWDDGDDLHAEPRAPYPHVRDVLALRSHQTGCALLIAGTARTAEGARLVESGWTRAVALPRAEVRTVAPRVVAAGDDEALARDSGARGARLPSVAWQAARTALAAHSPVLVQVPRRGYAPCLSCDRCRAPARCARCSGPLAATSGPAVPACRWCGQVAGGWECGHCGGTRMRAAVVGARRTAEELGRAFPGAVVRTSGRGEVLASVAPEPALVVATPGAEPVVPGGYGAAVLLDAWALLTRADLRAGEETVRRWCNAATLVRAGGDVVIVGADSGLAAVQALVRWDPAGFAARELGERAELGFPPAVRMAAVTGPRDAVADVIERASLPGSAGILGPVPVEVPRDSAGAAGEQERTLVRVPIGDGPALAAALRAAAGVRSARKLPGSVRIQIDPAEIG
ncbi:MAG: primosome assembly protein PriA, partial [Mycobacteriales bacterium]